MKKLWAALCALVTLLGCLLAFTACGDGGLKMNSRYINKSYVGDNNECVSFEFHRDGTGEFLYKTDYYGKNHYIVHFKWTYLDDEKSGVVCFFDEFEALEGNQYQWNDQNDWSFVLTVSKNVLMTTGGVLYINENYLDEIPNFNKK